VSASQHYFLVAALPMLFFDNDPPLSLKSFLAFCHEQLRPADYNSLLAARLDEPKADLVDMQPWRDWCARETALRNELIRVRAARLNVEPERYLRPADFRAEARAAVKSAFQEGNPRQFERALDQARWRFLEELEIGHHFDLARLVLYSLKLQLLEKRAARMPDPGTACFNEHYDRMLEKAGPWVSDLNNH